MSKLIGTDRIIVLRSGGRTAAVLGFLLVLALYLLSPPQPSWGAPFARYLNFTQPDQTEIKIWGQGDEFHAIFETTSGYTVIFDPQMKAYYYASLSSDGKSLISTGVMAHHPPPAGLTKHLRIDPVAAAAAARAKQKQWDADTGLSRRWNLLKHKTLGTPLPNDLSGMELAPPDTTTLGTKVGLTLLIDFSDAPATISQSDINSFLNGDSYAGYGNNGSVKKYFSDNSGARLTYTNVVTIYVRMNQPKSYYNNTSNDCGTQARLLINDALTILKARPDYNSTILPTFNSLTVDGSNYVLAFNVYFAGADSGSWSYGLWPHSWNLAAPIALGNGKSVYRYQITNVGDSLELGTFCHENGHMLCGFPDIYDYDYDSVGGAGKFCLMGSGGDGPNPSQVDAYLKLAAGWATVIELDSSSDLTGTLVAFPNSGYDNFYRFKRTGVATEYFLLENRQKSGRDALLPAAGIAVWHVDELGDKDNQSLTPNTTHANYELTLVQADNLWHFETTSPKGGNANYGDANDLYYQGNSAAAYTNILNDTSAPQAHWWDGTGSGMSLNTFSVTGQTMTFKAASAPPPPPSLFENGDFEDGTTGWTQSNEYIIYTDGAHSHGGSGYAWLAGYNNASDTLYHNVTIPADATAATISAWFNIDTYENPNDDEYDTITMTINNATTGALLQTLDSASNLDATGGVWVQSAQYDLIAYKGQTVRLTFTATTDTYYETNFFLDDVTLNITIPVAMRTLAVNFPGTGRGYVNINPGSISCNTTYSGQFTDGTALTLTGAAYDYSDFTSFTGDCTSNPCSLTMNANKTVSVNIALDTVHKARIGASNYFGTLPLAYASPLGTTILAWGTYFAEPLTCNLVKNVTIDGGWNDSYGAKSGYTIIQGPLTISKGSLTVEELTIK